MNVEEETFDQAKVLIVEDILSKVVDKCKSV